MYDLLVSASSWSPVSGNQDGSYLTMKSNAGILFGGCTIASGFSGVFCDQGYWQRAIASRPKSTTKAYMLGGLSWFAIPWGECECEGSRAATFGHAHLTPSIVCHSSILRVLGAVDPTRDAGVFPVGSWSQGRDPHSYPISCSGSCPISCPCSCSCSCSCPFRAPLTASAFGTTMGLASKALVTNPSFPTYPYALSAAQQSAGLVAPAAAVTLLGSGGAAAVLLVTFMVGRGLPSLHTHHML